MESKASEVQLEVIKDIIIHPEAEHTKIGELYIDTDGQPHIEVAVGREDISESDLDFDI